LRLLGSRCIHSHGERDSTGYGAYLLARPLLSKVLFVMVERMSWDEQTHSVPYPTAFHPGSEAELQEWLRFVENHPRDTLVSMASGARDGLRAAVIDACRKSTSTTTSSSNNNRDSGSNSTSNSNSDSTSNPSSDGISNSTSSSDGGSNGGACKFVDCREGLPLQLLFQRQRFLRRPPHRVHPPPLLQLLPAAPGDSNTRRSIFDALLAGCIPVFFNTEAFDKQYLWHFPENKRQVSILFDGDKVQDGSLDFVSELRSIPQKRIQEMRRTILTLIPQLLFKDHTRAGPGFQIRDAFDFALDGVATTLRGRYQR